MGHCKPSHRDRYSNDDHASGPYEPTRNGLDWPDWKRERAGREHSSHSSDDWCRAASTSRGCLFTSARS